MARKPDFSIPTHDGGLFFWEGNDGTVDASQLTHGAVGSRPLHGRIWNDSVDVGFYVHSPRTNQDVLFVLNEEQTREGEVVGWRYISYDLPVTVHLLVVNT